MIPSNFTQGRWGKSWDEARKEQAVQGIANLTDKGVVLDVPCGKLLGFPGTVINGENESSDAECLYGFSQDGYALVLGNAEYCGGKIHCPGMSNQTIHAKYLLAGKGYREFNPSNMITRIDIEIRNLANWYKNTAYSMIFERDDHGNTCFKALEYQREYAKPNILLQTEQYSITLSSTHTIPGPNVTEMTFRYQCCLEVCFSAKKSLEEARNFATNLSKFFSLCMGFHASIQRLNVYFDGNECPIQYYEHLFDTPTRSKSDIDKIPFPYDSTRNDIARCLETWLKLCDEYQCETDTALLKRAVDITVPILTYNYRMPVELEYISVSQALEALSRIAADQKKWSRSEHKEIKNELSIRLKGMLPAYIQWIEERVNGNSKSARLLMLDLMHNYKDIVEYFIPNYKAFVSDQQKERNAHSHGSAITSVDIDHLFLLSSGTTMLCFVLIWKMLGMDTAYIIDRLIKSQYNNETIRKIQKRYRENLMD